MCHVSAASYSIIFSFQGQIGENLVLQAEFVNKRSLWGYRGDDRVPFIKLTITSPKNLPKVRDECHPRKHTLLKLTPIITLIRKGRVHIQGLVQWTDQHIRKQHRLPSAVHDRHQGRSRDSRFWV